MPDFAMADEGPHYGKSIVIVAILLLVVSNLVVGLRFYVRLRILNRFVWDDWALLLAQVGNSKLILSSFN